jgi:predicted Zn-dependent protease
MKNYLFLLILGSILFSCGNADKQPSAGFNLFSIDQDKELGKKVSDDILSKPLEYPILDPIKYKEVYDYLNGMRDMILKTGEVRYSKEFAWEIRIIQDSTLNAFCTPGGYIYFYTGILKFLDSEDELMGVLAHEIAHADLRHSTSQMTKMFGVSLLVSVIAGNQQSLGEITTALVGLRNSRSHESEADFNSVKYLCKTPYNASGGAGFFEKILAIGGASTPEFLSTHPSPDNRVQAFHTHKSSLGCQGTDTNQTRYKAVMNRLP